MAYITLCDYVNYLGSPSFTATDFAVYANVASDIIDQLTRYSIDTIGFANLPTRIQNAVKKAVALQTMYIFEQGGVASLGDDSTGGFTVGKVSVSGGGSSSANATRGSTAVSAMAVSLLEQTGLMNPAVPLGRWSVC